MQAEKYGLLLFFSSVIICSVSAKNNGIIKIGISWFSKMFKQNTKQDRHGPSGDFIVKGNNANFTNKKWKENMVSLPSDSRDSDNKCELEIINNLDEIIIFCWIMQDGKLQNFYPINDGSIKDKSVRNNHIELTCQNDSFICLSSAQSSPQRKKKEPQYLKDVEDKNFVCLYRPTLGNYRHTIKLQKSKNLNKNAYLAHISCQKLDINDSEIIDNTNKNYEKHIISGFICMVECDVSEDSSNSDSDSFNSHSEFFSIFTKDLEVVSKILPRKACSLLQKGTPIWINKSLTYGHVNAPIVGSSMCFHPHDGQDWLTSMGLNTNKAGGIEMDSMESYLQCRSQWGPGGVLLHEYCHAFHNKHCKDGYNNVFIRDAYTQAMSKNLYDCVQLHTSTPTAPTASSISAGITERAHSESNGKTNTDKHDFDSCPNPASSRKGMKAYCCANCMEFFAELSVAFLWQKSIIIKNECYGNNADTEYRITQEYNKWFPYNCIQLHNHDINSCKMIAKMWNVPIPREIIQKSIESNFKTFCGL